MTTVETSQAQTTGSDGHCSTTGEDPPSSPSPLEQVQQALDYVVKTWNRVEELLKANQQIYQEMITSIKANNYAESHQPVTREIMSTVIKNYNQINYEVNNCCGWAERAEQVKSQLSEADSSREEVAQLAQQAFLVSIEARNLGHQNRPLYFQICDLEQHNFNSYYNDAYTKALADCWEAQGFI
jgi:hypothetical protein